MNELVCVHVFSRKLFGSRACWTARQVPETLLLVIGVRTGTYSLSLLSKCNLFIVFIVGSV